MTGYEWAVQYFRCLVEGGLDISGYLYGAVNLTDPPMLIPPLAFQSVRSSSVTWTELFFSC